MKKIFLLLILSIILVGCSASKDKDENFNEDQMEIDPDCQIKADQLNTTCSESNIQSMKLDILAECNWFVNDKDDYLENCNGYSFFTLYPVDDPYAKKITELCDNTKFGELTAKEISICKDYSDSFDFLESTCN